MTMVDYEKYSNMNIKQLTTSLLNAEKKERKLKADMEQKLKENKELVKFLKAKIKENLDKPKYYTLKNSPAMKQIRKDFENLPKKQQQELEKELEMELSSANHNALQS